MHAMLPRPSLMLRHAAHAALCAMALCAAACSADRSDRVGFDGVAITPCPNPQRLERELAGVTARLRVAFPETYAGRRISCDPLQVVVLLKGDTRYRTRTMQWPHGDVTVSFVFGSRYSTRDMNAMLASGKLLRWFPDADGVGTDAVKGQIQVYAKDAAKFTRYRAAAIEAEKELGVPVAVTRQLGAVRL